MKKYILLLICFYFLLLGCEGDFEAAKFAINLEYPEVDSKCELGKAKGNLLTLPFRWKPQGDIDNTDFSLVINDDIVSVTPKKLEGNILEFEFDVNYSSRYTWKIISSQAESEVRAFTTPSALPNDNSVPLAVEFVGLVNYAEDGTSSTVTINWIGGDQENDGSLRYDAYWSRSEDISAENKEGEQLNLTESESTVSFTIPNFDGNTDYYILVVARDLENSSSSILKFCQLCSN